MINAESYIVERIVLGAASIMWLYHGFLYLLQRDRFIILYCNYLISLVVYLIFFITSGHHSFEPASRYWHFVVDEILILWMLVSYVYFIAQVLEINNGARLVKMSVLAFYISIAISLLVHLAKIFFTEIDFISREYFFYSKLVLVTIAFVGLTGAAFIRKSTFVRIIIAGALIYAFFSFLTMLSIYSNHKILGISEYQLYFVGCFLDVLVFSSALGYRSRQYYQDKLEAQSRLSNELERNEVLLKQNQEILSRENELRRAQEVINFQLQNDVMAGLGSIKTYAELMLNKSNDNHFTSDLTNRIMNVSEKSMEDISDIIWLSRIQSNIGQELLSRMMFLFNKYLPDLEIAIKMVDDSIELSHEEAKSILLWTRELIHKINSEGTFNIHMEYSKLSLSLGEKEKKLV